MRMNKRGESMYIIWLELKKAVVSPIILVLLFLMIGFNIFQIWDNSYAKQELKVVNEIIETYGESFNDTVFQQMEHDIDQLVKNLGGSNTESFFEHMTLQKYEAASVEKQQQIDHAQLLYTYLQTAKALEIRYKTIDIQKLKRDFIKDEHMPPWLERIMNDEFNAWDTRFSEIIDTNEYKHWSFLNTYRMHHNLFVTEMKTLTLQSVLLIALVTAFITNYEFSNKTQLVIYSTKKGRKLTLYKGMASLIGSLLIIVLLFGSTLTAYFIVYDYSAIWHVPISSVFNWDGILPYITWWEIPLWLYFIFAISILSIVLLIVCALTFIIGIFLKNTYFTWCVCILLLVSMFVVPLFFTNSTAQWLMHFNITLLLLNPDKYFDGGTSFMMMQYHELYTLILWGSISILGSVLAIRYFNRKDVV